MSIFGSDTFIHEVGPRHYQIQFTEVKLTYPDKLKIP